MKLTSLLMLAACLQVSAGTNAQKLSISIKNGTLQKLFSEIEQQSGFSVFYNVGDLKNAKPVNIDVKDVTVEEILKLGLKNQALTYFIQEHTIFIKKEVAKTVAELPGITGGEGPPGVSGVVSSETGVPLAGATVYIEKLKKTGLTDAEGKFLLKNIPDGTYEVEISFVGYQNFKQIVTVENHVALITVKMSQSMSKLDETVVKGYYTTTDRLNTGDVTTVKGADINKQPVSDPILALEAKVPGLYIAQTSGAPGAYAAISIRGQNSIANGNDPLYIVDGVPFSSVSLSSTFVGAGAAGYPSYYAVSNSTAGTVGGGGGLSPFNALNPADIESVVVLKDGDATAIYGSRGANGVILITTKKGKAGRTQVDLNVYTGGGEVTRMMHLLNTTQYLAMRREAFANDGLPEPSITTSPTDNNYDVNGVWDTTRNTNWQKVLMGNTANFTNAQGSVSGGTANTQFVVGGGYSRQGTAFLGNYSDQKSSAHFNLTHSSENQRFHLQIGASYVYNNSNLPPIDFTNLIGLLAPDAPALYSSNGNLNWEIYNGSITVNNNPAASTYINYKAATNNLISNLNLSYQILPGLQLKSAFGYNRDEMTQNQITPSTSSAPPYNTQSTSRQISFVYTTFNTWIIEPQVNYQRRLGLGRIEVLLGSTFQDRNQNSLTQEAYGFSSDALITDPAAAANQYLYGGINTLYHYDALYGRLSYNWDDKYLLNLTARRDGSSRFGPGKQFGNFGAVGAAWIFTRESFAQKSLPFLSFGKLRASYGTTGNDQIPDYEFLSTYSASSTTYQGIGGLNPTGLTNPYLAWELVKKLEGGIELGFIKDRILLSASYFRNRTGNQLVGFALPVLTGFGSVPFNLPAVVQNTGLELTLNTINLKSKNLSWTSTANITVPNNKLVAFPNLQNFGGYNTAYVVGKSLFIREMYHSTGVDPQTGLYSFATKNANGVPSNPQDLVVTKPVTQIYYGGLDNMLNYRGFALDIFIQYVNQLANNYIKYFYTPGAATFNQPTAVLNRWEVPGDLTNTQRFGTNRNTSTPYRNFQNSDGIITSASFLRLKNLAFSYQFSANWLKAAHFQNARLYLQCQNLLTITKYLGLDPETGGLNLPPLRMLTAGFQVGF